MTTSVRVSAHLTRNLGDFNSVKIGVEVEDEFEVPEGVSKKDAIAKNIDRLYNLVTDEVNTRTDEAAAQLAGQ